MAIKYGFFNAVRNVDPETGDVTFDRVYDNETMNGFLRGIISQNGIFSNVGNCLRVNVAEAMTVTVSTGKAMVGNHWVEVTATEPVTLSAASVEGTRWDAIMLKFEGGLTRTVSIFVKEGAVAEHEEDAIKPSPIGNYGNENFDETGGDVELPLAYIKVKKNVSEIVPLDITDMRGTGMCPYISHLVAGPKEKSVDQWLAEMYDRIMEWSAHLTEDLNVDTYLSQYTKIVNGGTGVSTSVNLDMTGYVYNSEDVFLVYYNGLLLTKGVEYSITDGENYAVLTLNNKYNYIPAGNKLTIQVIKSLVGTPTYIDGDNTEY